MAVITLGVLGLLWIWFRLFWQGLVLLAVAGLAAYLAWWRVRGRSDEVVAPSPTPLTPSAPRTRADKPRRARKRRRRK